MSQYILAIDQGTTGSTVCILDSEGKMVGKVNKEYRQIFPKPGWVEHDPEDIWNSVEIAKEEVLAKTGIDMSQIAAIGITNQRETTVLWNKKTGRAIHNALVWQDRRTTDFCSHLKKKGYEKKFKEKTGLVLDPYFSGTKIRWLLDNVSGLRRQAQAGELAFGTVDSYLLWRLTGGRTHATEVSNASRTLLCEIATGSWSDELCALFGIP